MERARRPVRAFTLVHLAGATVAPAQTTEDQMEYQSMCVRVAKSDHAQLKALAKDNGISMQEIIRLLVCGCVAGNYLPWESSETEVVEV